MKTLLYISFFLLLGMSEQSIAQDWANLAKYENENALFTTKKSGEKRIVLMGDSITEFWLQIHPEFFKDKPYIDRGISGQTTPQMLIRFRPDVINLQPDVVVILAGVNDIAGNTGPTTNEKILGNIISMVELAKANKIKVILCSVLPASNFYWRPNDKAAETIIQLNQLIHSYANQHHIPYVDYHTAMADAKNGLPKEFADDGVHPNLKGYQVMESLLEKVIHKTLKK
ncbi:MULTISPECIES: SGNH/GDSL hydrolase family protein [Flavobacterium]|uniref:SGNH/GDSL hydrolase family protein n=1 Tax=Flavobacterium keumense TaxID=1306518 RepID=A0ABY8N2G1_9FLAO|nr:MULTISPECIES: SGNH/GDSL hydrolase family protein [Flavobacterium]WGK93840.1 SGNH/GDSL hydrolase family protein [Flavobacterium keumense]